jgi:hypothetical protein
MRVTENETVISSMNVNVLYGNGNVNANANDDVLKTKMVFVMRHVEIWRVLRGNAVSVAGDSAAVESGDVLPFQESRMMRDSRLRRVMLKLERSWWKGEFGDKSW